MSDVASLVLNAQADRRIKKGHLWIYSNEVNIGKTPLKDLQAGQQVRVLSAGGQPLGLAFVNPQALICGRLVSRNADQCLDRAFFCQRLQQALTLRQRLYDKPYYRLVYGDADYLPGIVIDRFGDHLVVQSSVAGFEAFQDELLAALDEVLAPRGVILRNDHGARELEELDHAVSVHGEVSEWLEVEENGCRFQVPSTSGQKTGWFYDHRPNRALLQRLAPGQKVLDVFSYMGGWGIQAACAGATEVTCVDSSEKAADGVLRNAALNGVADRVKVRRGRAVDELKRLLDEQAQFDLVVLDPPAFIKKRKDQKAGEAAYRHLNELAIRLLSPGGMLVSASCSMPLTAEALVEIVRGAARANDREAQLFHSGEQGADHPVHPAIAETRYLKAQFYRILPAQ